MGPFVGFSILSFMVFCFSSSLSASLASLVSLIEVLSSLEVEMVGVKDCLSPIDVDLDHMIYVGICCWKEDGAKSLGSLQTKADHFMTFFPLSAIEVEILEGMMFSVLIILEAKVMRAFPKPIVMVEGA